MIFVNLVILAEDPPSYEESTGLKHPRRLPPLSSKDEGPPMQSV